MSPSTAALALRGAGDAVARALTAFDGSAAHPVHPPAAPPHGPAAHPVHPPAAPPHCAPEGSLILTMPEAVAWAAAVAAAGALLTLLLFAVWRACASSARRAALSPSSTADGEDGASSLAFSPDTPHSSGGFAPPLSAPLLLRSTAPPGPLLPTPPLRVPGDGDPL